MKTNPKHLELLQYVVENYIGENPTRFGTKCDKDAIYFFLESEKYPAIKKIKIIREPFPFYYEVTVDIFESAQDYEITKSLEISNKDIKSLFKKANDIIEHNSKVKEAERKLRNDKLFNDAINNLLGE